MGEGDGLQSYRAQTNGFGWVECNGNGNGVPVLLIAMGRGIDAQNWLDSVKSRGPLLFLPGVAATAAVHRMDGILLVC
jgi:hypothetical protein